MRSPLLPDLQIKTTSTLSTETCIQFRLQSTLFILHLLSWNMKRWFLKCLQEVLLRVKHISSMRQLKGTEVNGSTQKRQTCHNYWPAQKLLVAVYLRTFCFKIFSRTADGRSNRVRLSFVCSQSTSEKVHRERPSVWQDGLLSRMWIPD